jgi:CRISPR/Cas system endoribonuclease Cas6 (RAMP superfamily)
LNQIKYNLILQSIIKNQLKKTLIQYAFGFLASEAVNFLKRVQNVMHSNIMSPKSMNIVFQGLEFAIQKGLAAQLVIRLHFINV